MYATMSHSELLGVVTTVVEENVALKSIVGEQSGVAKKYAELDAVRRAERDMLRKAVRPLDLKKVCSDVGVTSKFAGRARTDCGVVMCGVMSLLSDVGVSGLPLLKTVGGRSLSLMAKPMIFIDLCGEEPSSSDDDVGQRAGDAEVLTADATAGTSHEGEKPGEGGDNSVGEEEADAKLVTADATGGTSPEGKDNSVGGETGSSNTQANDHSPISASPAESKYPEGAIEEKEEEKDEKNQFKAIDEEKEETEAQEESTDDAKQGSERSDNALQQLQADNCLTWSRVGELGGGCVNGKHYSKAECYINALELVAKPPSHVALGSWMEEVVSKLDAWWFSLGEEGGGRVNGMMLNKTECYAKSLETYPNNSKAWRTLGDALRVNVQGGRTAGADIRIGSSTFNKAQCYVKSLEINPIDATVWRSLGSAGGGRVGGQSYTKMQCYVKAKQVDKQVVHAKQMDQLAGEHRSRWA